jgi:hypothetical protein
MGNTNNPTEAEQLSADLAHPNPNTVWARALEVFGEGRRRVIG